MPIVLGTVRHSAAWLGWHILRVKRPPECSVIVSEAKDRDRTHSRELRARALRNSLTANGYRVKRRDEG